MTRRRYRLERLTPPLADVLWAIFGKRPKRYEYRAGLFKISPKSKLHWLVSLK